MHLYQRNVICLSDITVQYVSYMEYLFIIDCDENLSNFREVLCNDINIVLYVRGDKEIILSIVFSTLLNFSLFNSRAKERNFIAKFNYVLTIMILGIRIHGNIARGGPSKDIVILPSYFPL